MLDFLAKPMGWIMRLFYNFISVIDSKYLSAYAMAIILATLVIKLVLLPLTLKQTKSMKIMQDLNPKLKELQDKYGKDPQTLQRKQMEMYKEANYSPFAGCLPMIFQLILVFAFFYVIRDPGFAFGDMGEYFTLSSLANRIGINLAEVNEALKASNESIIKTQAQLITYAQSIGADTSLINSAFLIGSDKFWIWTNDINRSFLWIKDLSFAANKILPGTDTLNGLNMGFSLPLIGSALPILAAISAYTTYLTQKITMSTQSMAMNEQAQQTNNMMNKILPVVIFVSALSFSSGLALYWVVSNVFQLVQQYIILHSSKKVKEE